jgi:spermidine/putrescine transport system permease protein
MLPFFAMCAYLFLYLPVAVLLVFSFNSNSIGYTWTGFTTRWYHELLRSDEVWHALYNSLTVAISTVILTVVLGALIVYFSVRGRTSSLLLTFYANLAIPEIVLAVGLLSLFYFVSVPLGLITLIASHTLLGLGYVVPIVHARFLELDKQLIEASLDLGATQWQTFFSVILPLLSPAMIASALLVFIISFDDFVLSFFCSGASSQTLPLYIFSVLRSGSSPLVSALSALMLTTSGLLVLIFFLLYVRKGGAAE